MKAIVFAAILALASAMPVDKKVDEKKPAEKLEEKKGLQFPLPEPADEGDLMLHGSLFYDRVEELRKAKVEKEEEKMILSVGREFLRRVHKYLEATPDFKIPAVLCHDSRIALNSSRRWELRVRPQPGAIPANDDVKPQNDTIKAENETVKAQNETVKPQNDTVKPQNDTPIETTKQEKPQNDALAASKPKTNVVVENATESPITKPASFEARRADFYERMGENYVRLLLKKFRKEVLIEEETEYIEQWLNDEAIHYGAMGIYCHEGENLKEIVKKLSLYIDEKQS